MPNIRRRTGAGLKTGNTFTLTRTFTKAAVAALTVVTRDFTPFTSMKAS